MDDDNFQELEVRLNYITDLGADAGRETIKQDEDPTLETIEDDFGACGDHRAHRPLNGMNYPIIFTYKGLIVDNIPKELLADAQSTRNLILLSDPSSRSGTMARHTT